jgi:hypothetical protein
LGEKLGFLGIDIMKTLTFIARRLQPKLGEGYEEREEMSTMEKKRRSGVRP